MDQIEQMKAIVDAVHVAYDRRDGVTIRRVMPFGVHHVDVWRDGAPAPSYQGVIEYWGLKGWKVMVATGKHHSKSDVLRANGFFTEFEDALTVLLAHESHRPVKQPWDEQAAEVAGPATLQVPLDAHATEPTPVVLYRPDQRGGYYLDGAELIFVPETGDGFLDFATEVMCDGRCDPDVRAVQIECQAQISQPGWATASGRVLVWIADPTHGQGYNAHWSGKPCWECGGQQVYDPHNARPVPCTQPQAHVDVTLANWRFNGCTTAAARLISMTAGELRARYGADALPVAEQSTSTRQNGAL